MCEGESEPRAEETGAQERRGRERESQKRGRAYKRERERETDRDSGETGTETSECGTGSLCSTLDSASADMPNFAGTWKMKKSENFDELLKALGESSVVSSLFSLFHLI